MVSDLPKGWVKSDVEKDSSRKFGRQYTRHQISFDTIEFCDLELRIQLTIFWLEGRFREQTSETKDPTR